MSAETLIRQCSSSVKGFEGCTGEASENSVSCEACFSEYSRRSKARDTQNEKERDQLISLLNEHANASGEWANKPKLKIWATGFLGTTTQEGKAHYVKEYGYYLLLKQKNSSKGIIITRDYHLGDVVRVWVLDKKGLPAHIWESTTQFAAGSLEAKELADRLEREGE